MRSGLLVAPDPASAAATAAGSRRRWGLAAPAVGAWAAAASVTALRLDLLAAGGLAAAALLAARSRRRLAIGLLSGLLVGAGSAGWHVHRLHHGVVASLARRHAEVDVLARVVRDPVAVVTASGTPLLLVDATVTAVQAGGWRPVAAPVIVLSYQRSAWDGMLPGSRVELVGRLAAPRRGDDVSAVLAARAPPVLVRRAPVWQRAAGRVRDALRRACAGLPADARGLLPGLVDGDLSATPASLRAAMQLTGLTHLEAVSGENLSVVLGVTIGLAKGIGLRRRTRLAVTTAALVGFVVLARPSPSVLRAAVMGGIVLLGMATGRRAAALPALAAAVLILVTVDPFLARSVGFVLSVLATGALLTVAPRLTTVLQRWMPASLAAALAVPVAAQLACLPVLVLVFGQLTPYAVPANLLAAPAVAPATVAGVVCALLATLAPVLGVPVAWLGGVPALWVAGVARVLAGLPAAGLRWSSTSGAILLTSAGCLGLLGMGWRRCMPSWTGADGDPGRR